MFFVSFVGSMRHIALNLIKDEKTKVGVKIKRLKAGWGNDYIPHPRGNLSVIALRSFQATVQLGEGRHHCVVSGCTSVPYAPNYGRDCYGEKLYHHFPCTVYDDRIGSLIDD